MLIKTPRIVLTKRGTIAAGSLPERPLTIPLSRPIRQRQFFAATARAVGRSRLAEPRYPDLPEPGERPESAEPLHGVDTESEVGLATVLLAEDNPVNQKIARRLLAQLGCEVDVVATGREALEASAEHDYAVILMDCQMPELDGYEATARIRVREGSGRRVPIIALTASAMPEDRERCLAAGMTGYISKPVRLDDLRTALNPWLPRTGSVEATGGDLTSA